MKDCLNCEFSESCGDKNSENSGGCSKFPMAEDMISDSKKENRKNAFIFAAIAVGMFAFVVFCGTLLKPFM